MFKTINIYYYLTTLVVVICLINGSHCSDLRKGSSVKSLPIVIDQPKDLCECDSESRFKNQVSHNYEIMYKELTEMDCGCSERDLAEFKKLLNEMKNKIIEIVDAYFKCDKNDSTEAILAAIECYDSARKRFRAYGRNASNKLSPKCNTAIQYVRRLPYISAENTITSMLTCAKLKSQKNLRKKVLSN